MRLVPAPLAKEMTMLWEASLARFGEEEEVMPGVIERWVYEHASSDLKLYLDYTDRIGDEGQLFEKDGVTYLRNSKGYNVYEEDYFVDDKGFIRETDTGYPILYSDGTPVPEIVIDPRLQKYFDE